MVVDVIEKNKLTESEVKNIIKEELKKLNYNFSYKGSKYLVEAIYVLYCMELYEDCNFRRKVYPVVAEKLNILENTIKCNIANATEKMFFDCKEEVLKEYIGYKEKNLDNKFFNPGAKTMAYAVLKKII